MLSVEAVTSTSPTQVSLLKVKRFLKILRHPKRGVEIHHAVKISSSQYSTPQYDLSEKAELRNSEEQDIWELLQEYSAMFQDEMPAGLPPKRDVFHEILNLLYMRPLRRPLYQLSPADLLAPREY